MTRHPLVAVGIAASLSLALSACEPAQAVAVPPGDAAYDPLAYALSIEERPANLEASVPPQCYTHTAGVSNACWTCHTSTRWPNEMGDWTLQEEYAFSDFALTNRWENLFRDRSAELHEVTDEDVLAYVREDNYTPLRDALAGRDDFAGFKPDLDFDAGFDEHGFANDGSGWRALRYKPFLGTFWPTNGSTDDVFLRLPEVFRVDALGRPSRIVERANLTLLEVSFAADPRVADEDVVHSIEPLDETELGIDLNGDGEVGGVATELRGLPKHYVGGASRVELRRRLHPAGTEYLHSVRYLDPDAPSMTAQRMKELRWSRKVEDHDAWSIQLRYEHEMDDKDNGLLPRFRGSPAVGLLNDFGWQYQGFIEDADGRLRLQTEEEHLFCMGCHSAIGVTADSNFTLARKLPGLDGWRYQDLRGQYDVPQAGHDDPEVLTYFERVGGGDEFRANDEILARFFEEGKVRRDEVLRAAPGGDRDLTHLILPSRERALRLNAAYRVTVREQSFVLGRDALVEPAGNVHRTIENGSTELHETGRVFRDGRLQLDWSHVRDE